MLRKLPCLAESDLETPIERKVFSIMRRVEASNAWGVEYVAALEAKSKGRIGKRGFEFRTAFCGLQWSQANFAKVPPASAATALANVETSKKQPALYVTCIDRPSSDLS